MESARPARPGDLDDLVRLWNHAVAELDGQRGGVLLAGTLHLADPPRQLRSMVDDDERVLVLGFIDSSAVGLASARLDHDRREPLAVIELVFVEPEAREVGVAGAILAEVEEWAHSRGVVGIDGPALPGNRSAKAFFETHGYQARILTMHRSLPRPAES